jgi:hypothetical protein
MAQTVKVANFADNLVMQVKQYTAEVEDGIVEDTIAVAQETRDELKRTSPKRQRQDGGSYAKDWTITKRIWPGHVQVIVHNKQYQLVHLLEKGHAKRGGGRTKAIAHVKPAETAAEKRLEKRIGETVRRANP